MVEQTDTAIGQWRGAASSNEILAPDRLPSVVQGGRIDEIPAALETTPHRGRAGAPAPADARRQALLAVIMERPGLHLRGLSRQTGLEVGVLRHHLRRLEKEGLLRNHKDRNRKLYYPAQAKVPQEALIPDVEARVASEIQNQPGVSHKTLRTKLGLPRTTLDYHIKKLWRESRVAIVRVQGLRCYHPILERSRSEHVTLSSHITIAGSTLRTQDGLTVSPADGAPPAFITQVESNATGSAASEPASLVTARPSR